MKQPRVPGFLLACPTGVPAEMWCFSFLTGSLTRGEKLSLLQGQLVRRHDAKGTVGDWAPFFPVLLAPPGMS